MENAAKFCQKDNIKTAQDTTHTVNWWETTPKVTTQT